MKLIKLSLTLMVALYPFICGAGTNIIETTSFAHISNVISAKHQDYGAENVLIVLDIDNTLLTSDIDLGGDIWYQWQIGKLHLKPSESQKVDCLYEDAIGMLYELGTMHLTEELIPALIRKWQKSGHTVIALTSRAPKYRTATQRELWRREIHFSDSALVSQGEKTPIYRYTLKWKMSYIKGIMMTSGMNKGAMLLHMLEKTGRHYDAIIFVDDAEKNIINMDMSFKNREKMDMTIFHYQRIAKERAKTYGQLLTESQVTKMVADWNKLQTTLNDIFPDRNVSGSCLTAVMERN